MKDVPQSSETIVQPSRWTRHRSTRLTPVEMVVVLAIVVVIGAGGVGALILIPEHARVRGTEALIAKIDGKLVQRLNEFNQRRDSILTLDGTAGRSDVDSGLAGGEPNRAHVIAVIRSLRQEFPDYLD